MGQGILSSRGGSGDGGVDWSIMPGFTGWEQKSEIITSNTQWIVPRAQNNKFEVRIFGGGGGARKGALENVEIINNYLGHWSSARASSSKKSNRVWFNTNGLAGAPTNIISSLNAFAAGGSGYMCNMTLTNLRFGDSINIYIGAAGALNGNGGPTTFGTIMTALGGSTGTIVANGIAGGDGGSGGGAVFKNWCSTAKGGDGQYGGGGGGKTAGKAGFVGGVGGSPIAPASAGTDTRATEFVYNGTGNVIISNMYSLQIESDHYWDETVLNHRENGTNYYHQDRYSDVSLSFLSTKLVSALMSGGGGYGGTGGAGIIGKSEEGINYRLDASWSIDPEHDDEDETSQSVSLMFPFYNHICIGGGGGGFNSGINANIPTVEDYNTNLTTFIAGGGGGYKSWATGGTGGAGGAGVCIINYIAPKFN